MNLLNVKPGKRLILKCYIISLFIPGISKAVLMVHGEQGSAKSMLEELIKMLVDPDIVKTFSFPKDLAELIQQLSHNALVYYDNLSRIPGWISDLLCRATTGSGFSKIRFLASAGLTTIRTAWRALLRTSHLPARSNAASSICFNR